jgi:hypothetical protein
MTGKLSIAASVGIVMLVMMSMGLYMANAGSLDVMEIMVFALVIIIVMGTMIILMNKTRNIKAGLPVGDELAKKVTWKAGYYAFLASIWIEVALIWYNGPIADRISVPVLSTEEALGTVVLLSGAIWIGLVLYFNRKGDIE